MAKILDQQRFTLILHILQYSIYSLLLASNDDSYVHVLFAATNTGESLGNSSVSAAGQACNQISI